MLVTYFVIVVILGILATDATCETYQELIEQAHDLYESGQYDSALSIASLAEIEAIKAFGAEDTSVARALFRMGGYHQKLGEYKEAKDCWLKSLAIREKVLGPRHLEVAKCLNNLANLANKARDYERAEALFEQTVAIRQDSLGSNHFEVGRALMGLASAKLNGGEYASAENIYIQALDIVQNAAGLQNKVALKIFRNLGVALMWQGKYEQARRYFTHAVTIAESKYGPSSLQLPTALSGLALMSKNNQEFDIAESLFQRAIAIVEDSLGPDHSDLCIKLLNLGDVYRFQGKFNSAEQAFRRHLDIRKKQGQGEGLLTASARTSLARIYYDFGDSLKFKEAYGKALSAYEDAIGLQYNNLARGLETFSWHFRAYDGPTCLELARRAFDIRRKNLLGNYSIMTEHEALRYAQFMRGAAANYISCFFDADHGSDADWTTVADIVFASKGQVSDEILARHKSLVKETDPATRSLLESLEQTKVRLSSLYAKGASENNIGGFREKFDGLLFEKERLESELTEHSASFRDAREVSHINAGRIASRLPDNSVLVEYVKYHRTWREPDAGSMNYLAVVLESQTGSLTVVDLGPADKIDSVISDYRHHMLSVSADSRQLAEREQDYRDLAFRLYALLWEPIEDATSDREPIFVAPDGALHLISFAGLLDDQDRYLVEKSPIHYLSAGRDAIRLATSDMIGNGLLIMGDPDYNADAYARLENIRLQTRRWDTPPDDIPESDSRLIRSIRSKCEQLNKANALPLPASRSEIEHVSEFWRQSYDDSVYCFFDESATEDNLKRLASDRRVIHIATHGFFTPTSCLEEPSAGEPGLSPEFIGENPLLLSGLFLAGANLHGQLADSLGVEDGIMTAEEVTCLDLAGVDMVVLSACESGLGEIESGEGVYGLRRAFQVAGARTVVSSLWPVSDRSTAEFMIRLYTASNQPLHETIRNYQLEQIEKLRSHGYSDHPSQWAAFITTGDWR
jgi:CHAT domain-containing protein